MTYKQIEAMREARLWIGQIVIPAFTLAASTMAIPEVRSAVAEKATNMKANFDKKIENAKKRHEAK